MCCLKVMFTIKATFSAEESASFINKKGTVEENVSSRLYCQTISWQQLHKGFIVSWKLCLNLCSLKWLRPSLSLVISLIPLGLWQSKEEFGGGRMKLSIFFLKTEILLEFLRLGSKLFHSVIVDGKIFSMKSYALF